MGMRELFLMLSVLSCVYAQSFRVCIPSSNPSLCQSLDLGGSLAICVPVESRVDCAIKLSRSEADFGVFSEEELLLLGKQQPNDLRVVASVRDEAKLNDRYAFEAVAVVRSTHAGGMEGLRGGRYCHPGFDQADLRWSPRVLKTLEYAAARTDQCPNVDTNFKTAEELEVENLSMFFTSACRPGPWSTSATVDNELKRRFPNLCSQCANSTCSAGYATEPSFTVNIAGVNAASRHIQALECLRTDGTVAYVAWQHVRDFFNSIRPEEVNAGYALLCEDGSLQPITAESVTNSTAACSLVKQPWGAIVASTTKATEVAAALRSWWPGGVNPGGNTWQSRVYSIVGGASARVVFEESTTLPANYTSFRPIPDLDASSPCLPARRWCTISALEQTKCLWLRQAAYTLGIQPTISCQQRANVFDCLKDIKGGNADFIATSSNYGFLARKHYQLSPVKLVQNSRSNANGFSRIAAFIRTTAAEEGNITRFENLRGTKACFPEFGGIAYVAFVRTAHERSVISENQCDYGRAVGEFFGGACAPGAVDAEHVLFDASTFDSSVLCNACRPANATGNNSSYTCAWDHSNLYYGNNGSLRCLADRSGDVAFVEMQNIASELTATNGLQASDLRALCRNNSLAVQPGVNIDENCLLAYTVNSEILARRQDAATDSVNALLDALDATFGYNTVEATQLINIEIYSPFDGTSDLLFKDSAVGLSEPSAAADNEQSRNYIELFSHLEACTGAAAPVGFANRSVHSAIALLLMTMLTRFVIY